MSNITFTTLRKINNDTQQTFDVVRLSRETTGKNRKLYDVDIHPNGEIRYSVNCMPVNLLPNLPSTKHLLDKFNQIKDKATQLTPHTPEYNQAWWQLKQLIQK